MKIVKHIAIILLSLIIFYLIISFFAWDINLISRIPKMSVQERTSNVLSFLGMSFFVWIIFFIIFEANNQKKYQSESELLDFDYLKKAIPLQEELIQANEKLINTFKESERLVGKPMNSIPLLQDKVNDQRKELINMKVKFESLKNKLEK